MSFTGYLCLGGTPLVFTGLTQALISNGLGPDGLVCNVFNWCDDLSTALGYPNGFGIQDSAWYDPNEPDSADFAGLLVTSIAGLEPGAYVRPVVEKAGVGAVLGQGRQNAPQIVVTALLMAASCQGMEFGYRWLRKACRGSCTASQTCGGDDLVFLSAMPLFPDLDCGPSDYVAYLTPYLRTFKNAALIDGPHISSTVARGCPECYDCGIYEVTFTLSATDPCMYREPVTLAIPEFSAVVDTECIEWVNDSSLTQDCSDDCPDPAACATDPNCVDVSPPAMPVLINPCDNDCITSTMYQTSVLIPNGTFPGTADGTVIITINAGDIPMSDITVQVWENPLDLPVASLDDCNICASLAISYIAANGTLVIDGAARTSMITCQTGTSVRANPFISTSSGSSSFTYPTFICGTDYTLAVTCRGPISPLASVSLQTVAREC